MNCWKDPVVDTVSEAAEISWINCWKDPITATMSTEIAPSEMFTTYETGPPSAKEAKGVSAKEA
jgi:hypothetical protein